MQDIDLVSYLLVFALAVIFSAFAVEGYSKREESVMRPSLFSFLSVLTWLVLAMCHLSLAYTSDFIILAWLFVGNGFIFTVYGFALVIKSLEYTKRKKKSWNL